MTGTDDDRYVSTVLSSLFKRCWCCCCFAFKRQASVQSCLLGQSETARQVMMKLAIVGNELANADWIKRIPKMLATYD